MLHQLRYFQKTQAFSPKETYTCKNSREAADTNFRGKNAEPGQAAPGDAYSRGGVSMGWRQGDAHIGLILLGLLRELPSP